MPITALETALYSKLSAGTALTTELGGTFVYNKVAPQPMPSKFVVFQYQGGGDDNKTKKRARNIIYAIRGVASTPEDAGAIDTEIDALLHDGSLSITGWANNYWLAREDDINLAEQAVDGQVFYHAGGQYRIRFEKD